MIFIKMIFGRDREFGIKENGRQDEPPQQKQEELNYINTRSHVADKLISPPSLNSQIPFHLNENLN